MRNLVILMVLFAASVAYTSCGPSLKVTSDYDKSASFTQYKTFDLYKIEDATKQSISSFNQQRINNAIIAEMTKKGFQRDSVNPDLTVNSVAIIKNKKAVSSNTDYYGYGGYYRPYMWGGGMGVSGYTTYNVENYKDGSLIIDIVDTKTKHLIWEGIGNEEIDKPLDNPDAQIASAVSKILAKYPPGK